MVTLVLAIAGGPGAFLFTYFPRVTQTVDRANWQAQETTTGAKPLFYANREPREIRFEELWLDNTHSNQSLTRTLKELRALLEETERGAPPTLLAGWGDRQERCVLQDLTIEEQFFDYDGKPLRAKVSLTLLELQPTGERTSSRVIPDAGDGDGPEP